MNLEKEFKKGCSILIPTWNSEVTLKRCLDSILPAFPKDAILELVIADKNSTDNTLKIIKQWAIDNRPIPVWTTNESGALGAARFACLNKAKYPTIFWLDSDIILPENYIEDLFAYTKKMNFPHSLDKISMIQGTMHSNYTIAYKWWHGFGVDNRPEDKKYGSYAGAPTSQLLVLTKALKMTDEERAHLKKLRSGEDSYLASISTKNGYYHYMYPIDTLHLEAEVIADEGNYKMLWSLCGAMSAGRSKVGALWSLKWICRVGLKAFLATGEPQMLTYTITIWINLLRACLKDERIINQRRLTVLKDW